MMMRNKIIAIAACGLLALPGCTKTEYVEVEVPRVDSSPKTLIFYGNIGQRYFKANVEAAGRAIGTGALAEGHRVLVCDEILGVGSAIEKNVIYELVRDKSVAEGFRRDTLRVHQGADARQTLDPVDMAYLLAEMRAMTPEAVSFGLALGTHGRGWIPKEYASPTQRMNTADPFATMWEQPREIKTRFLGHVVKNAASMVTHDYRIDIPVFAAAMEGLHWDFILMDVCLMSNIESLYEMRDIADYFIVSPAEVMIAGFPYEKIVSTLFADGVDWDTPEVFAAVGHDYVEHYRSSSDPYATIAVVDAGQLTSLAQSVRDIRRGGVNAIENEELNFIQAYEGMSVHTFYDLDEYMRRWARNETYYDRFLAQLRRTVVYKESTDYFYTDLGNSGDKPIAHYSGVSAFIDAAATSSLTPYYKETAWYRAVYLDADNGE
jgi:hypothetical protein